MHTTIPAPALKEPDASEYTGMSRAFLRQARMRGDGPPYVRVGQRAIRYLVRDLDEWLNRQRIVPAASRDAA